MRAVEPSSLIRIKVVDMLNAGCVYSSVRIVQGVLCVIYRLSLCRMGPPNRSSARSPVAGSVAIALRTRKILLYLGCCAALSGMSLDLAQGIGAPSIITAYLVETHSERGRSAKHTISGYVLDAESGESLIGASIYAPNLDMGTATNQYGYFSLTVNTDSITLAFTHLGYGPVILHRHLQGDVRLNIELQAVALILDEIAIEADSDASPGDDAQMSLFKLPVAKIRSIPALVGEVDVLKILQLIPGVQAGTEATTGLYVRGGGPDQNLFLMDGVTVYNPSHLFGFLSTFNGDAIKDVKLIKGGFPARYGGRLSSVVDLSMKDGNLKRFQGSGSIGLLSSSITLEGPIKKNQASFLVAGRRSYLDLLIYPFLSKDNKAGYFLYDLNAKVNYIVSERDRVFLSIYTGHDRGYGRYRYRDHLGGTNHEERQDLGWRNLAVMARWSRILSPKLFVNALLGYTRYRLQFSFESVAGQGVDAAYSDYYGGYKSGVTDLVGRIDFEYGARPSHYIRFGVGSTGHTYDIGTLSERQSRPDLILVDTTYGNIETIQSTELHAYVENEINLSPSLEMNVGLRASGFLPDGHEYYSIEPRVTVSWQPFSSTRLNMSYAYGRQYLHLLTTSNGLSLPSDLWVPVTERVRPQSVGQVAAGLTSRISRGYSITLEIYHKSMTQLIEYREGADFLDASLGSWQDQITTGDGWSYGTELFVEKGSGRLSGWAGYALSRTQRKFEALNGGRSFPHRFDRRHSASAVLFWKWTDSVDLSGTWVYRTGNAIWLPIGQHHGLEHETGPHQGWVPGYEEERIVAVYGYRNSSRMGPYHRLDIAAYLHRQFPRIKRTLSFGVYNAYNRRNPFVITASPTTDEGRGGLEFRRVTAFPVLPFAVYRLEF